MTFHISWIWGDLLQYKTMQSTEAMKAEPRNSEGTLYC